jgi:hypothetical protein
VINLVFSIPSDELQFETYEAGYVFTFRDIKTLAHHHRHLVDLILESDRDNPLFRSPIGSDRERPLQVLDIGTGKGTWAM